jgi:hypothetical protein
MKLFEIIGGEALRKSDSVKVRNGYTDTDSLKRLGAGLQAVVVDRIKKPGVVTKVFGFNTEEDGYLQFLRFIQKHQNNPFLPRIYKIRLYRKEFDIYINRIDSVYDNTGVVDMEKLLPLNSPKIKDAISHQLQALGMSEQFAKSLATSQLINYYHDAIVNKKIERNAQFEEVVNFLRTYGTIADLDLHSGNIMARLTSVGPQLVLIDPIWKPD